MRLSDTQIFVKAGRQLVGVLSGLLSVMLLLVVLATLSFDQAQSTIPVEVFPFADNLAVMAGLLVLLAGLSDAALTEIARAEMLSAERRFEESGEATIDGEDLSLAMRRAAGVAGWSRLAVMLCLSSGAFAASLDSLRTALPITSAEHGLIPLAAAFIGVSLALIVVERHLAGARPGTFPESELLARLVRVLLAGLLLLGMGALLQQAGFGWGRYASRPFALLTLAVALEVSLRAAAALFAPFRLPDRALSEPSAIAGLLRFGTPASSTITDAFRQATGLDVSQSWALTFLRGAALPSIAILLVAGWLLTGLVALPTTERAVYERFGRPAALLGPGLHVVLPWPAGHLRRVELGVLHDLTLGRAPDASAGLGVTAPDDLGGDRLWDRPHPSDATYLIASRSGSLQGFEVVDIDMRILWRVGDSDHDVLRFAYAADDPEAVIRGLAGRLLARRFAGSTLPAVLVEDRHAFSEAFGSDLQSGCDALGLGVTVVAIIIEAIHPPPGAAAAYHAVQAAEFQAGASVAMAHGAALEADAQSRRAGQEAQDAAEAAAAEIIAKARIEATLFDADLASSTSGGEAFLFERRLQRIGQALASRSLLVVDHRLGQDASPLLDLRGGTRLP